MSCKNEDKTVFLKILLSILISVKSAMQLFKFCNSLNLFVFIPL